MKHKGWIIFSGFLWLAIGSWLLAKGLHLIAQGTFLSDPEHSLALRLFGPPQKAASTLIALSLLIGFIKGRFVLSKTVKRVSLHIASLPLPIQPKKVYAPSYLALLASMMLLGLILRFTPIPLDLKGALDTTIGSALINGSLLYFRAAYSLRTA